MKTPLNIGIALAYLCAGAMPLFAQLGSISLDAALGAPLSLDIPGFLNSSNFNVSLGLGTPIVYDVNVALPDTGSAEVRIALSVTNVYVHDGPPEAPASPWISLGPIDAIPSGSPLLDSVGALTHSGKTYRISGFYSGRVEVVVSPLPAVVTPFDGDLDAVFFLEYPFLTNPVLRAHIQEGSNGVIIVDYQDGIYSNRVSVPLPVGSDVTRFYRLYSSDDDPTNAVIEFRDSLLGGAWVGQ